MLTESIGGECPVCEYRKCLLRYASSRGPYEYIACSKCGFAFAEWFDKTWGQGVQASTRL